ncbi:hypothetical protein [Chryseobacterium lactis]|nr:hypothetical protein [Chryseobacterium lactis]
MKKIEGGTAELMSCDVNMMCPPGLCCADGYICRDPRRYICI